MKTTMGELFAELNKDIKQTNSMSTREVDLNKVAEAMDKKMNEMMKKIEENKLPQQPQNAAEGAEKATEGNNPINKPTDLQKPTEGATEGATEGTEGGGEEGKE